MGNIIVTLILLVITALSILKIVSDKKKGIKCSGCPLSGSNGKNGCSC